MTPSQVSDFEKKVSLKKDNDSKWHQQVYVLYSCVYTDSFIYILD